MMPSLDGKTGRFCWLDLAATDARRAEAFYGALFGWVARTEEANGGIFTRLQLGGEDVGSLYQLQRSHLEHGVPSHWTPYVRVDDIEAATRRVVALDGKVMVRPFDVAARARIALIVDPGGALLGLWQSIGGSDHG